MGSEDSSDRSSARDNSAADAASTNPQPDARAPWAGWTAPDSGPGAGPTNGAEPPGHATVPSYLPAGGGWQPTGAPGSPPPPQPPAAGPRRTMWVIVVLVVALAVLTAAFATAVAVTNSRRTPEGVVVPYLNLLAAGRADAASAMVDPGVSNSQRLLLTDATMAQAQARIQILATRTFGVTSRSATVEATLSLNGQRYTKDFSVMAGPKEYGLLRTWVLRDPYLVPVSVTSSRENSLSLVSVAGTNLSSDGSGTQFAYPGVYGVTVPASMSTYLTASQTTLVANSGTAKSIELTAQPTQAFQDSVLTQVQQFVTSCVTAPTNLNTACPYSARQTNLNSMKVISQPTTLSTLTPTRFVSGNAIIQTQQAPVGSYVPSPTTSTFQVWGTISMGADGAPTIGDADS